MSFVKLDEAHRPDSSAVFLDTSIHCCFLKGQILAPRLKSLLKLFNWKGSSTYSKTEYGNVILANAQYYLRKLREFQSVGTLLEHISHVLPPLHREKRTWAFTLIISLGKTEKIRTRRTDASLRRLLKIGTKVIEFHCDSPLANGTNCHWGNTGLQHKRNGEYVWKSPNCKRSHRACRVDDFFADNLDIFEKIKNVIDGLDDDLLTDELRQFSKTIGEAIIDPSMLLDYLQGCRHLADALIAVDSKDYPNFATQNYKESQILTQIFQQYCYYLPNNPEHGIQFKDPNSRE